MVLWFSDRTPYSSPVLAKIFLGALLGCFSWILRTCLKEGRRAVALRWSRQDGKSVALVLSTIGRKDTMLRTKLLVGILVLVTTIPLAHAQQTGAPKITAITQGGVGFVSFSQGDSGTNATIGQWDTPYPYGNGGPQLPGAEPSGPSLLTVDIDVNDGGTVGFQYGFKTWDGGAYDWLDISLVTASGTIPLVSHLGQPIGNDWGSFWQSPNVSISKDLKPWKGQHVQLVFSVEQDGWGDQSQASVTDLSIDSCSVAPLSTPPFTDPLAQSFENGQTLDTAHLTPEMQTAETCFTGLVGAWRLNSAYRPSEYQGHLRDIWDKWKAPGNLQNNTSAACAATRAAVRAEFNKHGLGASHIRPASPNGTHTRGLAIDMSIGGLQNVDTLAGQCHLFRPFPTRDKVHFLHQ